MTPEELMKPRYMVIADWPGMYPFMPGDFIVFKEETVTVFITQWETWREDNVKRYPHLFKPLGWWEERTVDDLKSVKYAKVVEYVGYWRIGDTVPAKLEVDKNIVPTGYRLTSHLHPLKSVIPATLEDYHTWQREVMKRKIMSRSED